MMNDSQRRIRCPRDLVRFLGALVAVAALGVSIEARCETPAAQRRADGAKALAGSIVEYREESGKHILYLESKGGILTPLAPPGPEGRRQEVPPLKPAANAGAAAETAARKPPVENKVKR